jgi:hypothetical protein
MVWRMAALFASALPAMQKSMKEAKVQEKTASFFKGGLDRDMLDKVKVLDPSFNFEAGLQSCKLV